MSLADIWINSDWVVKILMIFLVLVVLMASEKIYQYVLTYLSIKQLSMLQNFDELDELKEGFVKDTLIEIKNFKGATETLSSAFIGVKLDLYEQYMMRFVTFIGVIAVLSPMLGLIGTFIGVWHVFEGVGNIGLSDPSAMARGIKEVIVDTMAGLIVAVIAMIFYKTFEFISMKNVSIFEEKVYRLLRGQDA